MHSALGYFQRCVELSRKAGLVRVEIPNAVMVGHCLTWTGQGQAGLREVRHAVELSNRVGLAQTEVMALESIGFALVFHGAYDEAQPWIEKAIAAARQAGARRYLATNYMLMAACRRASRACRRGPRAVGRGVRAGAADRHGVFRVVAARGDGQVGRGAG